MILPRNIFKIKYVLIIVSLIKSDNVDTDVQVLAMLGTIILVIVLDRYRQEMMMMSTIKLARY